MARPRTARLQVAYDLGRRGEKPTDQVANDPQLLGAYDDGLSAFEDAGEQPPGRPRPHRADGRRPRARFADTTQAQPATPVTPAPAAPSPAAGTGAPSLGLHVPDGSGLLLGLFGYALAVNFLHGGQAQVRAWMAAKFLNKPTTPAPATTPAIPGGPGPVGGILGGIQNAFPGLGAGTPTRPRFGAQ